MGQGCRSRNTKEEAAPACELLPYRALMSKFVLTHGKIYENMHLSFVIRRMKIFGILLLFDVV
jgi:hypothetical protein